MSSTDRNNGDISRQQFPGMSWTCQQSLDYKSTLSCWDLPISSAWGMSSNPAWPRLSSILGRTCFPGLNCSNRPSPSPQTTNGLLENVTSSQGNLGSFIAVRTQELPPALQTWKEKGNLRRKIGFKAGVWSAYKLILKNL